jgi:hypothetical protein
MTQFAAPAWNSDQVSMSPAGELAVDWVLSAGASPTAALAVPEAGRASRGSGGCADQRRASDSEQPARVGPGRHRDFPADRIGLFRHDDERSLLVLVEERGLQGELPVLLGVTQLVLRRRRVQVFDLAALLDRIQPVKWQCDLA